MRYHLDRLKKRRKTMVQMLDFKKLAEQISSNSASKLGLRNELKQNRNFGKRIPKLR